MELPQAFDGFLRECIAAAAGPAPHAAIHAALTELVDPRNALGDLVPAFTDDEVPTSPRGFRLGGEHIVHQADDLTVMVLDTLPGCVQPAHDHAMAAFIGVFEGCEQQRFWARSGDAIVASGERDLRAGEVLALGERAIHAISSTEPARAVHVYLGDIYDVERSVFDPLTLEEHEMTADRYDAFCRPSSAVG